MVFPSEQEQIEKFEKDHVAQHYLGFAYLDF